MIKKTLVSCLTFLILFSSIGNVFAAEPAANATTTSNSPADSAPILTRDSSILPASPIDPSQTNQETLELPSRNILPPENSDLDIQPDGDLPVDTLDTVKPIDSDENILEKLPETKNQQFNSVSQKIGTTETKGENIQLKADNVSGALTLEYPLVVPPGRDGLQPDLRLSYNSQNTRDDGIFGYGWSLNIPYIERVNKDGVNKMYFKNYFSSSLSGELKDISLTDSKHGQYGAKIDDGSMLKYEYKTGDFWEVTDKDGTIYKFGINDKSKQIGSTYGGNQIYKWMLEEVRDTNDNFIKYEYFKDIEQLYPNKIKYTGNGSNDGIFTMTFSTKYRDDHITTYSTGFAVMCNYLISELKITNSLDSSYKKYNFAYSIGDNLAKPLLSGITESGSDTNGVVVTKPTEKFEYQKNDGNWKTLSENLNLIPINLGSGSKDYLATQIFDVNGDTLPDIVYAKEGSDKKVYINKGDGTGWNLDTKIIFPLYFTDKNDLDLGVRTADVNGDGLIDLIQAIGDKNGYVVTQGVYINKGDGTGWTLDSKFLFPAKLTFVTKETGEDNGVMLADVDGDNLTDILSSSILPDNNYLYYNHVLLNRGDNTGWDLGYNTIPIDLRYPGTVVADVNNDGLVDILHFYNYDYDSRATYINNGTTWYKSSAFNIPRPFAEDDPNDAFDANGAIATGSSLEDVNGDGLIDIYYYPSSNTTYNEVYINNGTEWLINKQYVVPQPFTSNYANIDHGLRVADFNGDGLIDFLYRNDYLGKNIIYTLDDTTPNEVNDNPDLLSSYTKNTGGNFKVKYQSTHYDKGTNKGKNSKLPFKLFLISEITLNDNVNSAITTSYEYAGGKYYYKNPLDRKFSGFHDITIKDDLGVNKIYYHQGDTNDTAVGETLDLPGKIGQVYLSEKYDKTNKLFYKNFQRWGNVTLGTDCNLVQLSQVVNSIYDGNTGYKSNAEQYIYDTFGNLTQSTSLGEISASTLGEITGDIGSDKFTTSIAYAQDSKKILTLPALETVKDQNSVTIKETKNIYDGLSLYSATKGNLTQQSFWQSGSKYTNINKTYNSFGLLTQESDGLGNTTSYTYDSSNLYPAKITNALNQSENFTYDYTSGQVKQYQDLNGNKFENTYDGLDRIKEIKIPNPVNPINLVSYSSYSYTDTAPVSIKKVSKVDGVKGPINTLYFDGLGRMIQSRNLIEDPNVYSVKDFKYNGSGQIEKESLPYTSDGETKTSATSNDNLYIKYSYDALGRATLIQNILGSTSYTYDDWKTTIKDAENNTKDFFADAYGNLVKVLEYNEGNSYKTEYQYNGLGNITKLTDSLSNIQYFSYDGLGRKLSAQDLHATSDTTYGKYSFSYDDANNLKSEVDANGQTTNYSYDKLNRVITEDFTGQAGVETLYTYDNCAWGLGLLCSAVHGNTTTKYIYNPLGDIAIESRQIDGKEYKTQFTYDFLSNPLSIFYPDNNTTNYTYNTAAKLKSVKHANKDIVKNIIYSPTQEIEKIELANNTVTTNKFDASKFYRLTDKITTLNKTGTTPVQLQSLTYTYDKVGDITKLIDVSPGQTAKLAEFGYDNLYRLKSAIITATSNNQKFTQNFQYNSLGNITSKTGQGAYSYAGNGGTSYATPHAVTTIGTTNFVYDKNGNLTSDGKQTLKWDYKDRLIESAGGGKTIKYTYDHTDERVKKADNTYWAIYVNKFYELRNDKVSRHIYAGDLQIASIETGPAVAAPAPAPTPTPAPTQVETVYEDAEDGDVLGWKPSSTIGKVTNIYDQTKQSKVINLGGTYSTSNPNFKFTKEDGKNWDDVIGKIFSWEMNFTGNMTIRLTFDTNQGERYLVYSTLDNTNFNSPTSPKVYVLLDKNLKNGTWQKVTRDLQADFSKVVSGTTINKITLVEFWGMGKLDNIKSISPATVPAPIPTPLPTTPQPTPGTLVTKTIYHHGDHLGGANLETDENGTVIEAVDYYPFGEIRVDNTTTSYKNNYKFTGKELDADTGLYYYSARYYNPQLGRFISQDPWEGDLNDPQSLNKYSYVRNNPLKYIDPTGETFSLFNPTDYSFDNGCSGDCVLGSNYTPSANSSSGPIDESGNSIQLDLGDYGIDVKSMIETSVNWAIVASLLKGRAGLSRTTNTAKAGEIKELHMMQPSVSLKFSKDGTLAGKSVKEVIGNLKSGKMSPKEVPINYSRVGNRNVVVNNRSFSAVKNSKVKPVIIERTGTKWADKMAKKLVKQSKGKVFSKLKVKIK
ncbi:MAG: RHS repeat-associated core domain-containing protein [Patescibacteria group bacterium]